MQDPGCSRLRMRPWWRLPTFYKAPRGQHCTCHWQGRGAQDWQREALPKTPLLNGIFQAPLGAERGFAQAKQCLWCLGHCCPVDNSARRQSATRKNTLVTILQCSKNTKISRGTKNGSNSCNLNKSVTIWWVIPKVVFVSTSVRPNSNGRGSWNPVPKYNWYRTEHFSGNLVNSDSRFEIRSKISFPLAADFHYSMLSKKMLCKTFFRTWRKI